MIGFLIRTLGPEFWDHPHPHGGTQHQQGQGLILEHISYLRPAQLWEGPVAANKGVAFILVFWKNMKALKVTLWAINALQCLHTIAFNHVSLWDIVKKLQRKYDNGNRVMVVVVQNVDIAAWELQLLRLQHFNKHLKNIDNGRKMREMRGRMKKWKMTSTYYNRI